MISGVNIRINYEINKINDRVKYNQVAKYKFSTKIKSNDREKEMKDSSDIYTLEMNHFSSFIIFIASIITCNGYKHHFFSRVS